MKKALSLILALVLCLSLCACAKPAESDPKVEKYEKYVIVIFFRLQNNSAGKNKIYTSRSGDILWNYYCRAFQGSTAVCQIMF